MTYKDMDQFDGLLIVYVCICWGLFLEFAIIWKWLNLFLVPIKLRHF